MRVRLRLAQCVAGKEPGLGGRPPTWMEWKEKPGCTLKNAMLFQSGSAVAVGITSGSLGVSAGGRGHRRRVLGRG